MVAPGIDLSVKFWSVLMFRFISATFQRLIEELTFSRTRYLYPQFQLRNRFKEYL